MTYKLDSTLTTELLEQISKEGLDYLPELMRILVNAAMQVERQKHLGVEPYERSPEAVSPTQQMLGLGIFFMGLTFVIFALYGILASGISSYLVNSPKAVRQTQRSFAVIFAVLAAQVAFSEQ